MRIATQSPPRARRGSAFAVAVAALLGVAGALLVPLDTATAAESERLRLDVGHIDAFNLALGEDGLPILNLKEDVTGSHVQHAPEDVELVVKEQARTFLPDIPNIPQALRGSEAYYLPLSQNHDLIWPGWDSIQLGSAWNRVEITVQDIEGPGDVHVWSQSAFGGLQSLLVDGGTQFPNTIRQNFLAHVHANWAFTQPGEYRFTVNAVVSNASTGASHTTNTAEYLFSVGDFQAPAPTTLSVSGIANPYVIGSPVVLQATPDLAVEGAEFLWQELGAGDVWVDIPGQRDSQYLGVAREGTQTLRAGVTVAGVTLYSDPAVIEAPAPEVVLPSSLTLTGALDEYEVGQQVLIEAKPDVLVQDATYRWETSKDGREWQIDAQNTSAVWSGTASADGFSLRATLMFGGQDIVTADSIAIVVNGDPGETPVLPTSVTVQGGKAQYASGDPIELSATVAPSDAIVSYRWETSNDGTEWRTAGGSESRYSDLAGARSEFIRVVITGEDDVAIASEPVRVNVVEPIEGEPEVCYNQDIDHGHVDMFNLSIRDGAPTLTLKEDVTGSGVVHAADAINLVVKESARTEIPDVEAVPAELRGTESYFLPMQQDQTLLWPGWDSQGLAGTGFDQVDINITQVEGPGSVHLWSQGSMGTISSLLDGGGYQLPGTIHQSYLAHVHSNWAFSEAGVYRLHVHAVAINSETGQQVKTNSAEYVFTVGTVTTSDADYRCSDLPVTPVDPAPPIEPAGPKYEDLNDFNRGDVTLSTSTVVRGTQLDVTVPARLAGQQVAAFLYSEPKLLNEGRIFVRPSGGFTVTIPASAEVGAHKLAVVDAQNQLIGWADLRVVDPAPPAQTPPPVPNDDADEQESGNGPQNGVPAQGNAQPSKSVADCSPSRAVQAAVANNAQAGSSSGTSNGASVVGTEGHFDFGPAVENGAFTVMVKDDRTAPPTWRLPSDVVFQLGDAAKRPASEIPAELAFVAPAGQDVYMIQQIQESGVPWLGWNTQHETIVNGPGSGGVQLTLDGVTGPGEVAVFLSGGFGALVGERVFDTVGGPTSYAIPANTHQHGNWVFTEPGMYEVAVTLSADGESASAVLRFAVGVPAGAGAQSNTGAQESAGGAAHATGVTPDGKPCALPKTGSDSDDAQHLALLAFAMVMAGAFLMARHTKRRAIRAE